MRSPLPEDQPTQGLELSFHKALHPADQNEDSLADLETQKYQAFPSHPLSNNSLIPYLETQKSPVVAADPLANPMVGKSAAAPIPPPIGRQRPEKKRRGKLSQRKKARLLVLAGALLIPSFLIIFELVSVALLYKQLQDGIAHVQNATALFRGGPSGSFAAYADSHKLLQAQGEISAAHADFASASDKLDHDGLLSLASALLPAQISQARALGHIASDGTIVLQQLLKTARDIAPSIAPAFQKSTAGSESTTNIVSTPAASLTPYLSPASYQEINHTLDLIAPTVHEMAGYTQKVSTNALPLSLNQRQLLASILPLLPLADAALAQRQNWRDALGWFLGIDAQRAFLIEPMDSAELRATGGFTGQFGELTLHGAHMGPIKLSNIGKYEEDHTAEGSPPDLTIYPKVVGQSAPAPYAAWWPVANFGLRDANLSADFPTSARIAMDRYRYEFGGNVDGVIMFTPTLIGQILHVTGPITIPAYGRTITDTNLESLLHYYQLDNNGILQEEQIEGVTDTQVARKLFTQRVTSALFSAVAHLPFNKLLPMANGMLHAMKTRDLQIYVTNPQLEALIGIYGSTDSMDRSTDHDGLFIVQSNVSASKASQYVTTDLQDAITLDNRGGATHHLQVTLDYQQQGDVYGFDTYRDYLRVYVPVNSRLLAGNGFDRYDRPYCGDEQSGYRLCQADVYGDGSLVCTPPVEIGYATSYLNDPYAGKDHPLDVTGPPPNVLSDEPGRAMFGGWVVIPKNCTMKVTLSWYVPPMSQQPYRLLLQEQASVSGGLDLTLQPAPEQCTQGETMRFSGTTNGEDRTFLLKQQGSRCSLEF